MSMPGQPHASGTEEAASSASTRTKRFAVAGVAVLLLLAWRLGLFEAFRDPAALKELLLELGPWGYLAFVAAYAALQPFGMPGTVFVFAAPLIWPWPVAFALSMAGTMAASVIGFSYARFIARDWVAKRIPARFRKYDESLASNAFATVALLRLIFWMPQVLHAFFGVSKVRFWTHFWGSFVGYLVPLLLVSFFGEKVVEMMTTSSVEVWGGMALVAAIIAGVAWWARRRARAREARSSTLEDAASLGVACASQAAQPSPPPEP